MDRQQKSFRDSLLARDPLVGTFIKTPTPIIAEVLCHTALDVFCIDVEHAPFGRLDLDLCIAAFRAAQRPCLVRVADHSATGIRNALDSGATGIVVPHVINARQAQEVVKAAHFGDGGRGYAGSTRAAHYTNKPMARHLADSKAQTTVVVQIEDIEALDNVAAIAAVPGVDALFVGRVDLAVAMGKTVSDSRVMECVRQVCIDGAEKCIGMFTPDTGELAAWRKAGASFFLLSSDHNLMLSGADALVKATLPDG